MKMPKPPPDDLRIFRELSNDRRIAIMELFTRSRGELTDRYLPWDEFRHRTPAAGFTREEWWLAVKLARQSMQRELPLLDKSGRPFTYALPDEALRAVEQINRDASGRIEISEQVTNPATRDRYLVSSLIEEAITSSQLEGAATTHRVAKEMIRTGRPPRNRDERMIFNNYLAMRRIHELKGEKFTPDLVCQIHRIVTEGTLDNPDAAGRFQLLSEDRVVVGDEYGGTYHVPPPAEELNERVQRICDFANEVTDRPYVPPVLRAIIVHFMLGYDHPFEDGNGRTARALFYWCMLNRGYWLTEFLAISKILKGAPSKYARSFIHTEQDDGDLTYFQLYHLGVIQRAISDLHEYLARKMAEIRQLQQALAQVPGQFNHRQIALIDYAIKHPDTSFTAQSHGQSHNVVRETARQDLLALESRDLLEKRRIGRQHAWFPVRDFTHRLMEGTSPS
jgi:Fic family protein